MAGGAFIVFLILVALIGPHLVQNPDTYNSTLIDPTFSRPIGPWGGISLAHPLGVEPVTGRDMLARIVVGTQYSLLIGFLATVLAVVIGVFFGIIAGYFGGWVDAVIARSMDVFLAFPLLVFAIALIGVIPNSAWGLSGNELRVFLLVFVIGFFAWPYMGRLSRCGNVNSWTRPVASAPAARIFSSASSCPTWSRRSWSTRRCSSRRTSSSRLPSTTSASGSSRPRRAGARCFPTRFPMGSIT
jgi:ABC-type dipeptide/oligopeptide/nickel transport system permease subunit